MKFKTVIGLEVHLQLNTHTKIFCACAMRFGVSPNSQVCPVCLGLPGSLPVLNNKVLNKAVKLCLALDCQIAKEIRFDRKNYFYPDLPKGYQISQYDKPVGSNGKLNGIGITRIHLEEDAGKLIHNPEGSLVDYNRAGTPLLEIVSEPDIQNPKQAYDYLSALKSISEYLEVSDCNMEEGSLRCDANISISPIHSEELGVKIEIKNMNSFRGVQKALEYEEKRQREILNKGEKLSQETRLWDAEKEITLVMRSKEEANDYRYFPEPDLPCFFISLDMIEEIKKQMPELPQQRQQRFISQYKIPEYDAAVLTKEKKMADYFEKCLEFFDKPKTISNWLMRDVLNFLKTEKVSWDDFSLSPQNFTDLLKFVEVKEISINMGREVFLEMLKSNKKAKEIIAEKGLAQVSDEGKLKSIIGKIIIANSKSVKDFQSGKEKALMFLVGQVMKETKGKANAAVVQKLLREECKKSPLVSL
ncbi:MAG: Asp-tRNA(Asn)/Glu-tRNA(Gln) amidotransferase subunit GatB [Candidatus Omnitrophica bacterium]|nr:Asp-tRNA(Asn)/Glu-tRNA(Gln) amidotransferase subunit GatB [Candidatus Omnitrophota bacterium]